MRSKLTKFVLIAAVITLGTSSPASADLVFDLDLTKTLGSGLGAVNTVVTAHQTSTGNTLSQAAAESGCMGATGTTATPGDCEAQFAASYDQLGGDEIANGPGGLRACTDCENLLWVVNISEEGTNKAVTLLGLQAFYYSSTGTLLYVASYTGGPLGLGTSESTGLGATGFAFRLDPTQTAIVAALPVAFVGGGFTATNTDDGNESLHVLEGEEIVIIPEPTSLLLLGSGLLGLAARARRKMRG